jgi:hypothetical protein
MSHWHCRTAAAGEPELCKGPRHDRCGMRYDPGEYTVTWDGITIPGIGTVRMDLPPAFVPKSAAAIVWHDGTGWAVEFDKEEGDRS